MFVKQKAWARNTPTSGWDCGLGMEMPRDFSACSTGRNVAKREWGKGKGFSVGTAKIKRGRIMVAFDPNPFAARLKACDPTGFQLSKRCCRAQVVKAVAKADYRCGVQGVNFAF